MNTTIKCNNCNQPVDIKAAVFEHFKSQYDKTQSDTISDLRKKLTDLKNNNPQLISKAKAEGLEEGKKAGLAESQRNINEQSKVVDSLNKTIVDQSNQISDLLIKVSDLTNTLTSSEKSFKAKEQLAIDAALQKQKEELDSEWGIKIEEEKVKRSTLERKAKEMQQSASQGSMQVQGEGPEIYIENSLISEFPNDLIEEVPKGKKGADCLQNVFHNKKNCGKLIWEVKNSKTWQSSWIPKLKSDQAESGALIAVLVTKTYPKEIKNPCLIENVFICQPKDLFFIAPVLRALAIKISNSIKLGEDTNSKQRLLMEYTISQEFILQFENAARSAQRAAESNRKFVNNAITYGKRTEKEIQSTFDSLVEIYGNLQRLTDDGIETINCIEDKRPEAA